MNRHVADTAGYIAVLFVAGASLATVPAARGEKLGETYVRVARQLRSEVLRVDQCPHDPAALVALIGRDHEALAEAFRQWIAWEPELGVVRGPGGTMSAQAGGDWDRAVLLQAVLGAAGYPARFVVAERGEAARAKAVDAFLAADAEARTLGAGPGVPLDEAEGTELLERYGVPVRNRTILMANAAARWRRLLDEAYDAGEGHADGIAARLASPQAGPPAGFDFSAWRKGLEAAAAEAVAVEVQTPDGWALLELGPDGGVDWSNARRMAEAPADRRAGFALTLEMNLEGEGAPEEPVVLLEHAMALGELFRHPIRLEIAADSESNPGAWDSEEWYLRVKNFEKFQAVLEVGPVWLASPVFDLAGQLYEIHADGRIGAASQIGEAMQRGFGLFGRPAEPAEHATRIESLVLTLEISRPEAPPVRQQRLLYGALRQGVAPTFHADILAAGGPVGPESVAWLALDAATANAGLWAGVSATDDITQYPNQAPARMPRMLYEWMLARLALVERHLDRNVGLTFASGPAVSMWTTQILLDDERREVSARTALDVVWDGLRLGPRAPEHASEAERANVSLGVGATSFESLLLRELVPPATIRTALAEAELFLPQEAEFGTPAPLAEWAIQRNEAGRTVLLAGGDAPNSWWSVDPLTGATVGRGDAGEGQAAAEYSKIQKQNLRNLKCVLQAFGGGSDEGFVFCMTGLEGTGGKMGAAGSLSKKTGTAVSLGKMFSKASDAMTVMNGIQNAQTLGGGQ